MIKEINKNYILIFFLTILFFLSKYFYSLFFFKEDFLISKILLETSDIQYYPLVETLSRFDFFPSFNSYFIAKKIITFPFLSIIWHAILFKFFGYYSFIILEFFFKFLVFIVLYKIFKKLEINSLSAIFISFLILALPSFFYLIGLLGFKNLNLINQLVDNNLGYRFPRPLITFFYLNLFLYFLICFFKDNQKNKVNFIFVISVILIFLAHSFFYLFISCSLLFFTMLIIKFKKNFFFVIKKNILTLFSSFLIILIGLFLLFLQSFYGESDYSSRIGLFEINSDKKFFLFKYFLLSFLRLEMIILFSTSFILKFFSKNIFTKNNIVEILNIFFYLFICSVFAPFIFVFLSLKVISLYHFFDLIIFIGIYYIILNLFVYIFQEFKNLFIKLNSILFLFFIGFFIVFLANRLIAIKIDQRQDLNSINKFLLENDIIKTNKVLFTNDTVIINLWLHHKNKYLSVPEGFSNSLNDSQVEESLLLTLKSLNLSQEDFKKFIRLKSAEGRNFFSVFFFNYKYQANALKIFSKLNDYSDADKIIIKSISPLRASSNIVPENAIEDLFNKYINLKKEEKYIPDIIIINKNLFINFDSATFIKVLNTKNFLVYKKI
jgi:hypothetical protein